jgi:predicted nucleic acid-binding protein
MGWCFESEADAYTDAVLAAVPRATVLVPAIWPLEVANVLLVAERRRRIARADAVRFLDLLGALPIVVEPPVEVGDLGLFLALAHERRLSAYDAAYLHLAMREHAPLATRDRGLRAAARAAGVAEFASR